MCVGRGVEEDAIVLVVVGGVSQQTVLLFAVVAQVWWCSLSKGAVVMGGGLGHCIIAVAFCETNQIGETVMSRLYLPKQGDKQADIAIARARARDLGLCDLLSRTPYVDRSDHSTTQLYRRVSSICNTSSK